MLTVVNEIMITTIKIRQVKSADGLYIELLGVINRF